MVSVNAYIQLLDIDEDQKLIDYLSGHILWIARIHMTTNLDFLVLGLKILHNNE